jgi:hypothetical protein
MKTKKRMKMKRKTEEEEGQKSCCKTQRKIGTRVLKRARSKMEVKKVVKS